MGDRYSACTCSVLFYCAVLAGQVSSLSNTLQFKKGQQVFALNNTFYGGTEKGEASIVLKRLESDEAVCLAQ